MSQDTTNSAKVTGLIDFHGLTLWVVEHQQVAYLYAKPLCDLVGLDWRTLKRALSEEEGAILYGTRTLNHPVFAMQGGLKPTPSEGLYIRLDRSRMFLARVNTRRMKANGNIEGAEALLKLQIEWAEALHSYETHGVAVKQAAKEGGNRLISLLKARAATTHPGERAALTRMIADAFDGLGYPVADAQGELPLPGATS